MSYMQKYTRVYCCQQEHDYLVHFARLANTPLKEEESERDNHVLAFNFAKYLAI